MQSTTTIATEIGVIAGVAYKVYKAKPEERKDMARTALSTSTTLTSTSLAGEFINSNQVDKIHEKYSSAYMSSRTEEELAGALQKLDYLDSLSEEELVELLKQSSLLAKEEEQTDIKTI